MLSFLRKPPENDIAVYTAIYGGKDELLDPKIKISGCDFYCFTDNPILKSKVFKVLHYPAYYPQDAVRSAKVFKVLSHFFLPKYRYTLWIDGRIFLRSAKLGVYIKEMLANHKWAMYVHPDGHKSIFEEAERIKEWKLDDPQIVDAQIAKYEQEGYRQTTPMIGGTIIFRNNLEPQVIQVNESWWEEIRNHSRRDQLSFNYVAQKHGLAFNALKDNLRDNQYFLALKHKDSPKYTKYRQKIEYE